MYANNQLCTHKLICVQIAEVDKLNAIINSAEKDMLRLRKQYEVRRGICVFMCLCVCICIFILKTTSTCASSERTHIHKSMCKHTQMHTPDTHVAVSTHAHSIPPPNTHIVLRPHSIRTCNHIYKYLQSHL
jgi:hypothetical protein